MRPCLLDLLFMFLGTGQPNLFLPDIVLISISYPFGMVIKEWRELACFKLVILRHSPLSGSVCSWKGAEAGLSPVKEAAGQCVG